MRTNSYRPEIRIVSFIDILGFRELTKRGLDDPALLEALDRSLSATKLLVEPYFGYKSDTRMFSDCICSSSTFEPDNVVKFIYTIEALQMNLACRGVFVRGGIAIGRHFENARMIVSEGLIDAYELESKQAVFPRIIASEETVTRIVDALRSAGPDDWDGNQTSLASRPNSHIRKDRDGTHFISYLMSLHRIDRTSIIDGYITSHKSAVEAWLAEGQSRDAPARIRQKHEWVRDYHNTFMREYFRSSADGELIAVE